VATLGDLVVNLSANTQRLKSGLNRGQQDVQSFSTRATSTIQKGVSTMRAALGSIAGTLGTLSVAGAVVGMVKLAADAETLSVQLEVLTGSAGAAAKVMKDVSKFAASTPFQKAEIGKAAKQLLAFNGEADNVIDELRMIGDLAAATGIPLGDLAEIYGKARVQGRLFGEDINQLTGRGIPIVTALATQFGVAESEIKKMVSEGKVGFPELERAFKDMTGDGGKFAGMMERLSETTAGKFSTMKDNFIEIGTELGTQLLPAVNELLSVMLDLANAINGLGNPIKTARLAFNDMSFDALIAKERVKGFFGDDVAKLRIQSFEKQRQEMEDKILGISRGGEEIINATELESMWRNMQGPIGAALAGAVGSGALTNLVAGESLFDQAMRVTSNGLQRGGPTGAAGGVGGEARFAAANERGSSAALSTILNARNQERKAEQDMIAQLKKQNDMLAGGIMVTPPAGQTLAVVEDLT
jgi:tape measure domain-containing protein